MMKADHIRPPNQTPHRKKGWRGWEGGSHKGGKVSYSSERRRTESAADLDEIPVPLALVLCGWDGREGRDRRGEEKKEGASRLLGGKYW